MLLANVRQVEKMMHNHFEGKNARPYEQCDGYTELFNLDENDVKWIKQQLASEILR